MRLDPGCLDLRSLFRSSLVTANWFLALTGGIAFGLIVLRTQTEEDNLIERFGEEYLKYMERTGRFFPERVPE